MDIYGTEPYKIPLRDERRIAIGHVRTVPYAWVGY